MKRQKAKRKGQSKERVFGCDLISHLEGSGHDVPQVLKSCTKFIEENGIVDGIYRLSGISSNIQKLRQEFDTEKTADLSKDLYLQDIHCISSLCKAYFRELPNPLLMYQLYDKFADAVNTQLEGDRLLKIRSVLQDLPLSHYRTLEYLMRHLLLMASHSSATNMHVRNLAIVWAPNLLRSKDIESSGFNGTAAFMEVRVQSIVVEFILNHVEQLFGRKNVTSAPGLDTDDSCQSLPSSTSSLTPGFDETPFRSLVSQIPHVLNMGDGPPAIRPYHSIIELPDHRRKGSLKVKKWRSIFNLGRSATDSKRKICRNEAKDQKSETRSLRPAKSMDSLSCVPFTNDDGSAPADHRSPARKSIVRRDSLNSARLSPSSREPPAFASLDCELLDRGGQPAAVLRPGSADSPRSAKAARQRADKRVAMHISGPFSVTLPDHVSTLLLKAPEPGPEPGGGEQGPQPGGGEEWEPREQLVSGTAGAAKEEAGSPEHSEPASALPIGTDLPLELLDSFSFLDSQEAAEACDWEAEYPGELGQPLRSLEEMEPFDHFTDCDRHRTGLLAMSIESELMGDDIDGRELRAHCTQVHYEEFSVEPPLEEIWSQEEPSTPPEVPHQCPPPDRPQSGGTGTIPAQETEPMLPDHHPQSLPGLVEWSVEAGHDGCSTLWGFALEEEAGKCSRELANDGCSTEGGFAKQQDLVQGSTEPGNTDCSTEGGFAKQEEHVAGSTDSENPDRSTEGGVSESVQPSESSTESVNASCSTGRGFTDREKPGEGCPQPDNAGCSTNGCFSEQGEPDGGSAEPGDDGCSTDGGFAEREECGGQCAVAGSRNRSTDGGITEQEEAGGARTELGAVGRSTGGGFAGREEHPGVPAPAPMRLESSVVRVQQVKALPVVPPKPHYAKLPPALKVKRRHEFVEPQAGDLRPSADPPEASAPPPPAVRCAAWRSSGSLSFDEAVALARQRKNAPCQRPLAFRRGDSLPSAPLPHSPPPPPPPPLGGGQLPCPRDRLSLPRLPDPLRPPIGAPAPECQPRCRSLALEGEESE